jgi:hypothetical protein
VHDDFINRLLSEGSAPMSEVTEAYRRAMAATGRAHDPGKLIVVECTNEGVTGLEIDPRALRWGAKRLAGTIKTLIAEALADLQRQVAEELDEALGTLPDRAESEKMVDDAVAAYDRVMTDAMGELDAIRRRLQT